MEHFGFLSLLPPLIAIVLAFSTRQVLPSLFVSIWVGAMMIEGGNPFAAFATTITEYIAGSIARPWNASIITYSLTLGGMIGVVTRSGGISAIADSLAARARSPRAAQASVALMGLVIFFDDYANTILVGNTMRPLTDRLRISREKLAYLVDSTAAPIASMALVATWTAYEIGLIRAALDTLGIGISPYEVFLISIPYRFYSITTLLFVIMVIWTGRDFGPMLTAERRARTTGKVIADGAVPLAARELTDMPVKEGIPLRWYNAALPVAAVVLMVAFGLYIHGYGEIMRGDDPAIASLLREHPLGVESLRAVLGAANAAVAMMWAAFTGAILAILLVTTQRILTFSEALDAWLGGAKSFLIAVMILVLAWGIGRICQDVGTAAYLVEILEGRVMPEFVPVSVFLLGCVIAFATGTSYGAMAILMPIAVPLVFRLHGGVVDSLVFATIGAVFTGAVFGDHCSPLSDTTILSSMACASDHIDHVKTQAPYALTAAGIAVIAGFVPTAWGLPPVVSIVVAGVMCFGVIRLAGKAAG